MKFLKIGAAKVLLFVFGRQNSGLSPTPPVSNNRILTEAGDNIACENNDLLITET